MADTKSILVPVDGSANSDRAVKHAIGLAKAVPGSELHLLNVQPSVGSLVTMFVPKANVDAHHREEGEKAMASAMKLCAEAGVKAVTHISVGRAGPIIGWSAKARPSGHSPHDTGFGIKRTGQIDQREAVQVMAIGAPDGNTGATSRA